MFSRINALAAQVYPINIEFYSTHRPRRLDLPKRAMQPSLRCRIFFPMKDVAARRQGDEGLESAAIYRHKTAIRQGDCSRPVQCRLRDGLLDKDRIFFDSGRGRGKDIELLTAAGITCSGWDPAFRPDAPWQETDVVNVGYVINVIENPEERRQRRGSAWDRHSLLPCSPAAARPESMPP